MPLAMMSSRGSREARTPEPPLPPTRAYAGCQDDLPKPEAHHSPALIQAKAVKNGKHLPVRLVFVCNVSKKGDYIILVTTFQVCEA